MKQNVKPNEQHLYPRTFPLLTDGQLFLTKQPQLINCFPSIIWH